ncbi:MAG TPA: aminotransferase class I/II-fold pyridoxal phosphate-dependent enzyme [Mycobacteriales bacterium]|nr:aminotransferase class I/II-fold pyridoxal phosphate-dependent enzyme [Mycobacteriales bacterium]
MTDPRAFRRPDTKTLSPRAISTRAAHPPAPTVPAQPPVGLPVYRTAVYGFDSMQDYADVLGGRTAGYVYSRIDNPTSDAFAAAVAALEGAEAGQPFASGMAAISTTLLGLLNAGDHVVAQAELYGGTFALLSSVLPRFGITCTLVPKRDGVETSSRDVAAAVRPETALIYAETVANPTMSVADLPGLSAVARAAGVSLVVDSTFASPVVCRPMEWGADLVVHSATKYIGGHSDSSGGVVVGGAELVSRVRAMRAELGAMLSPDEAFLLHRGLQTLPLRVERHSTSALAFATAMAAHPSVASVMYPGLSSHPDHELARSLFSVGEAGTTMYGGCVLVTPRGDASAGLALCDALTIGRVATSLGGVHTVVSHVPSTTHRQLDDTALAAAGIGPAAVRVSVGLEDSADLVADFTQALDRL